LDELRRLPRLARPPRSPRHLHHPAPPPLGPKNRMRTKPQGTFRIAADEPDHLTRKRPCEVRYDLERRDPEFKQKMAQVLCVYREVKLIKETAAAAKQEPSDAVAIVSTMRSPAFRQSPRPPRTCRPSPADMRPWRATTS